MEKWAIGVFLNISRGKNRQNIAAKDILQRWIIGAVSLRGEASKKKDSKQVSTKQHAK